MFYLKKQKKWAPQSKKEPLNIKQTSTAVKASLAVWQNRRSYINAKESWRTEGPKCPNSRVDWKPVQTSEMINNAADDTTISESLENF